MIGKAVLTLFIVLVGLSCCAVHAGWYEDNLVRRSSMSESILLCRLEKEGRDLSASIGLRGYADADFAVLHIYKGKSPKHINIGYTLPFEQPPFQVGDQAIISGSYHDGYFQATATAAATPENLKNIEALVAESGKSLQTTAPLPGLGHEEQGVASNVPNQPPLAFSTAKASPSSPVDVAWHGWMIGVIALAVLTAMLLTVRLSYTLRKK